MVNLAYIIGLIAIFGGIGILLMHNYSFRTHRKLFLTGLISALISLLLGLILVLAYFDY